VVAVVAMQLAVVAVLVEFAIKLVVLLQQAVFL
jgi:hypothetical protein